MNLNDIQTIITLVILLINVLLLVYNVVKKLIKRKKSTSDDEEEVVAKSEDFESLVEVVRHIIPTAIEQAEASGIIGAENKKLLALSQVLLNCNETGFDFKANAKLINEVLEELIEFSKKVNAKGGK